MCRLLLGLAKRRSPSGDRPVGTADSGRREGVRGSPSMGRASPFSSEVCVGMILLGRSSISILLSSSKSVADVVVHISPTIFIAALVSMVGESGVTTFSSKSGSKCQ